MIVSKSCWDEGFWNVNISFKKTEISIFFFFFFFFFYIFASCLSQTIILLHIRAVQLGQYSF